MLEWKWRYDSAKPEAALKLIRRLAAIVAEAHTRGMVHRDLKPSNILLRPSEDKKFTLWITDFGWGQIQSVRSLELAKVGPRGEQQRLAQRGAASALYASPQQSKKEPPAPTDDVHALGVIWFQLLKRDPSAAAPVGTEWVEDLRRTGSPTPRRGCCRRASPPGRTSGRRTPRRWARTSRPSPSRRRPTAPDGSKLISLRNPGSAVFTPTATTTARGKPLRRRRASPAPRRS